MGIDRTHLRRFRALLRQVEQSEPEWKHWEGRTENLLEVIQGFASFVFMVKAEQGRDLLERANKLRSNYPRATTKQPGNMHRRAMGEASARGHAAREPW